MPRDFLYSSFGTHARFARVPGSASRVPDSVRGFHSGLSEREDLGFHSGLPSNDPFGFHSGLRSKDPFGFHSGFPAREVPWPGGLEDLDFHSDFRSRSKD